MSDTGLLLSGIFLWTQAAAGIVVLLALVRLCWLRKPLIPYAPRRDVPWGAIDVAPVILLLAINVYSAIQPKTDKPDQPPKNIDQEFAMGALALVSIVVCYGAIVAARSQANPSDFGLNQSNLPGDGVWGALTYAVLFLPVMLIHAAFVTGLDVPSEHPFIKELKQHNTALTFGLLVLNVVVFAPLCEEFLYRVILQGWLEKAFQPPRVDGETVTTCAPSGWRGWAPIVVSAALFALAHLRLLDGRFQPDPIPLFVLALGFGYLYRQTHRLWPSVFAHAAFNLSNVIGLWIQLRYGLDGG